MTTKSDLRSNVVALALALVVLLTSAQAVTAQTPTVSGQATALRATLLGVTTALASTGSLVNDIDARQASALTGSIPSLGGAQALHATTISSIYGWDPQDDVSSEASLANLALSVAGSAISAAFVMAEAVASVGGGPSGWSIVEALTVNGVPIAPAGTTNQTVVLGAIKLVINEVRQSAGSITLNALHITSLDGTVDVVVSSASAGTQ